MLMESAAGRLAEQIRSRAPERQFRDDSGKEQEAAASICSILSFLVHVV